MSGTITASSLTRRPFSWAVCLLLAVLPIIANAVVALISVVELRGANASVERALEAIVALKEVEDFVEDSAADRRLYSATRAISPPTARHSRNWREHWRNYPPWSARTGSAPIGSTDWWR